MSRNPCFDRLSIAMLVTAGMLTLTASAQSDLSSLEGAEGHAPRSALSDLEGTQGHGGTTETGAPAEVTTQLNAGIACLDGKPCIEQTTQLSLRVLARPFSNVYREPVADNAAIAIANVAAFRPLYVFARRDIDLSRGADPAGWYQVGRTVSRPDGWMQARDVFEWRQALLVSYTHPGDPIEGRKPVLMFRDQESLQAIVDDMDMAGRAQAIYDQLEKGEAPASIISMEPKRFVDITNKFYMLPILQWSQTQINGDDARLLQLAAAVPGARGSDTLANQDYRSQADIGREKAGQSIQDIKVDIVFVMDTTRSMQPFIDMTREAVARMARSFTAETRDRFRFGLVTFRDSLKAVPELEYLTKNHTPALVDAEQLVGLLDKDARATRVGSLGYDEDVFAGVDAALHSAWRENSVKIVILIGDASSHPKGSEYNSTKKDETDLRREYDDARVHLLAIHLQNPRAAEDHPVALAQFGHLARIRGDASRSALEVVNAEQEDAYRALSATVTTNINTLLNQTLKPETAPVQTAKPEPAADGAIPMPAPVLDSVANLWEAALIEYIGQDANPPKDIVAWTLDRDLINPADRALDVRVLVTREQLSTLAQTLDHVVQALMRAEVTQAQFFEALQSVSGQTMKRPEEIGGARQLAETGLLPAFIQGLPYRSDILSLTDEMFASMTAEQRAQLEWSILAKLEQYRAINEQVDAWFRLNEEDPDSSMVYPLQLDYLP